MEQNKLDRINKLARLSKLGELSLEEKAEQEALRKEYISEWRAGARAVLENIYVADKDGNLVKLKKKEEKKEE